MTKDFLERVICQVFVAAQKYSSTRVTFNWHGGEPLLLGIDFYERALDYQKKHNPSGLQIINTIQTNGTLIDDNWSQFFRFHKFVIGVSLDGPEVIHEIYRRYPDGSSSYSDVMEGILNLKKHEIHPHILAVVHDQSTKNHQLLFDYFKSLDINSVDFLPCFDPNQGCTPNPIELGEFLVNLFKLWIQEDNPNFEIRLFKSILYHALSGESLICTVNKSICGYPSILPSGETFFCDSFDNSPFFSLGNLNEKPLFEIWESQRAYEIRELIKSSKLGCHSCDYLDLCGGGCSRYSFNLGNSISTIDPYFCEGYKIFFSCIDSFLSEIAKAVGLE
jgi:uncharacterized protein